MNVQDSLARGLAKPTDDLDQSADLLDQPQENGYSTHVKVKRTPKNIYKVPNEDSALLGDVNGPKALDLAEEEDAESGSPIVTVAIYINLAANATLLVGKIVSHFVMFSLILCVISKECSYREICSACFCPQLAHTLLGCHRPDIFTLSPSLTSRCSSRLSLYSYSLDNNEVDISA